MRAWSWLLLAASLPACAGEDAPPPRVQRKPAADPSAEASPRGPSTPEERAKAVEAAHRLEADPLDQSADEERARLTVWVMQIPDIYVKTCPALLSEVDEGPTRSMLMAQMLIAAAAFIVEHPSKAKDDLAVYTAALESAVRAYSAAVKTDPDRRTTFLDGLVAKQREGKLGAFVKSTAGDCTAE